ncbi:MAG TPA: hypothetical protein VNL98_07565, partial [Gemmatimonadales bacterium]|nr:hypothetical protein [Gemmatimonadales bacterium]
SAGGQRRSYGLTAEPGVWERRFIAAPPQLDAVVQLYRQLGFEVRLDRITQDELDDHCNDCHLALHLFRAIYVRRPAP